MDDVYYRIYMTDEEEVHVVCMRWLDEFVYKQDQFITTEKYASEAEAKAAYDAISQPIWALEVI